jgi:hypothetical protein
VRYQIAPLAVDLTSATRESVMDAHPATYRAMARELEREGKVRPFGAVEGEKISDPRNYLYLDLLVRNDRSAVGVLARLRGDRTWRSSHLGRHDYAIGREGWVRTAVELPPGARANDLEEMALECLVAAEHPPPVAGACRVESVSKVFLLDPAYIPGPNLAPAFQPLTIPTGAAVSVPFRIR